MSWPAVWNNRLRRLQAMKGELNKRKILRRAKGVDPRQDWRRAAFEPTALANPGADVGAHLTHERASTQRSY